ncbi:MAG: FAD:protein FMN transferase [Rhodothermales bacterium]|nr:FAD:protein FMN transferase [Rhodothermales bacterium]MBO6779907.1 FAD:protein FMN transferase [Rhodothermales bacterium]
MPVERVRLAAHAMATRFEIVVDGDPVRMRAAAEEAIREVHRVEQQLSWFVPESVVSRINQRAAQQPVKVPARIYELLQLAQSLHQASGGAFDPTVAPDSSESPAGMDSVVLEDRTVRFTSPQTLLNLGAIGKGYALDLAAEIMLEAGARNALLHGGTSTAVALGSDGVRPWTIGVSHPVPDRAGELIARMPLVNACLSVSGIYNRGQQTDDGWKGHIMDPRSGKAVSHTELAAAVTYRGNLAAARADALSTALLVTGTRGPAFEDTHTLCYSQNRITEHSGPWQLAGG